MTVHDQEQKECKIDMSHPKLLKGGLMRLAIFNTNYYYGTPDAQRECVRLSKTKKHTYITSFQYDDYTFYGSYINVSQYDEMFNKLDEAHQHLFIPLVTAKQLADNEVKVEPNIADNQIKLVEIFDVNKLAWCIENQYKLKDQMRQSTLNDEKYNPFNIAEKMLIKSNESMIPVTYEQHGGVGRYFALESQSLGMLPRELRHTISKDYYVDIDQVNSHPTILQHICSISGIECPSLQSYNSNREELLNELECCRDTGKEIIISIMNNGCKAYDELSDKPQWLQEFKTEIASIHMNLAKIGGNIYLDHVEKCIDNGKTFNHLGSYTYSLMTAWENNILMCMYEFFGSPDNAVLCFDGIMLLKKIKNREQHYDLAACEDYILQKLGIAIMLKCKPMNEDFDIPSDGIQQYTNPVRKMLLSAHTDQDFADYFLKIYASKFLVFDNILFEFEPKCGTWIKHTDDSALHNTISSRMHKKLHSAIFGVFTAEQHDKQAIALKSINAIRNWNRRLGIINSIKSNIKVTTDPFDSNPHLFGFSNGIYDLELFEFRKGRPEDYVMMKAPYKFTKPIKSKTKLLWKFINSIMPCEDERDYLLKAMASAMYGKCVQNIFILTGEGGNGKDTLISKFLRTMLGDYYYYGCVTTLTERRKSELNQGIANMNNKRCVVWSEPPKDAMLQGSTLKEISGVDNINARGLYSSNTVTVIRCTAFILCNEKPPIDNIDGGVARRIRVIPFRSLFKLQEDIANMINTDNVHEANEYFDSIEFRNDHRVELFHILLVYFKQFADDGFLMKNAPQTIKDLSASYLRDCDDFMGWFDEVYEQVDDTEAFIQLKDIYKLFRESELFMNYSKVKKRGMTRKKMIDELSKKPCFKGYWKDRHQYMVNGVEQEANSAIMRYKLRIHAADARNF